MERQEFLSLRNQFPMLKGDSSLIYLDSAATTLKPQPVIDAITAFYKDHYGTVHRAVYRLAAEATASYDRVRQKVQRFIGAGHIEEIVFTRGTTDGINLLASSLGKGWIQAGDEIVIAETEHHANIVPWQMVADSVGAKIIVLPCLDSGELDLIAAKKIITTKIKVVAVAHVTNTTAAIHPVAKIADLAHAAGALIVVDGAQSISHMPVDVRALNADFFVFSGHKAYGPTGVGVLYGRKELLDTLAPYQGGGDMIDKVTFEKTTYQMAPLKFEAGTPPIAEVIGLGAAIDFLEAVGMDKVAAYEEKLTAYARDALAKIPGLRLIGTQEVRAPIISFVIEGIHPLDLAVVLDGKNIAIRTGHMCAQPTLRRFGLSSMSRASFGIYTTFEDIDRFIEALHSAITFLS